MKRMVGTLAVVFLLTSTGFSQKVKFDKMRCSAQKCYLPVQKVAPENRTYSIEKKGIYSHQIDPQAGRLYGWEKVNSNPTVHGVVSLYGFSYGRSNLKSQKKEKKDKEGNVTDKYTEYWYEVTSRGKATLYVYGPQDPFRYKKKDKEPAKQSKREKEKAAEEAAAAEAEANNPFLKDVDVEPAGDDEEGADEGAANIELELVKRVNMDQTKSFKTAKARSAKAALENLRNNVRDAQYDFKEAYPAMAFREAMRSFNNEYGFRPIKSNFLLQKIKSGDIREVDVWNNAVDASKKIMGSLRFNTDITQTQEDMKPILDFFQSIMSKFSMEDKKERKVAKAAFENLVLLQGYLDMHAENLALCNKYIDDKKLDKICKKTIKKTEKTMAHLEFLGMSNRHVPSSKDNGEDEEIEEEDTGIADDEGGE